MKKRIKRKLHAGEFKHFGNVIAISTNGNEATAEAILSKLEAIIDKFSLTVAGGGTGRLFIPAKEGNKQIPNLAATVVKAIIEEQIMDKMMFCVYVKGASSVPQEALDAIKEAFADETYNIKIGKSIDLWHTF